MLKQVQIDRPTTWGNGEALTIEAKMQPDAPQT